MNENVNPDNVNPHFEHPGQFGLTSVSPLVEHFPEHPVRPCPSCGHCPTCGRGPGITYFSPLWRYEPNIVICGGNTTAGEGHATFGPVS